MHNDYVRVLWDKTTVPTPRDLALLDELATRSVNGDEGGTWSPRSRIAIGRAGLALTTSASSIRGGVQTRRGGRIVLGDDDYVAFAAPRSREVIVACIPTLGGVDLASQKHFTYAPLFASVVTFLTTSMSIDFYVVLDRWMHDGATLSSAVLTFRVARKPAVDVSPPSFEVARRNKQGVSRIQDVILGGTISPPSPGAYYNGGDAQEIHSNVGAGNNVVDLSAYTYLLHINDHTGPNDPGSTVFHALRLSFTNIVDMRPQ